MKTNLTSGDRGQVGVYLVQNQQTQEAYVGSGDLWKRFYAHRAALTAGTHYNRKLQEAWNRNPNFDFVATPVKEQGATKEENRAKALALEQEKLNECKESSHLLNHYEVATTCPVGPNAYVRTEAQKEAGRKTMERLWADPAFAQKVKEGRANAQVSDETRAKQSISIRSSAAHKQHLERLHASLVKPSPPREELEAMARSFAERGVAETRGAKIGRAHEKQTIVDGIVYGSLQQACDAHGIGKTTGHARINNPRFPGWQYAS